MAGFDIGGVELSGSSTIFLIVSFYSNIPTYHNYFFILLLGQINEMEIYEGYF